MLIRVNGLITSLVWRFEKPLIASVSIIAWDIETGLLKIM